MIESISIASVATYATKPETLSELSSFNFVFGSNGTGKTTLSRIIANEAQFPTCSIAWKAGVRLQPMVYNHDFVERNFIQSPDLKGVFTLGEKQGDTLAKIATAKAELDALVERIESLTRALHGIDGTGGKKGEVAALEAELKEKCWAQKQKHDAKFQSAFEGYRNSAEKFKVKVLQELDSNTAALQTQADLEDRARSVFGPTPSLESTIPAFDTTRLISHESNPILRKRVIGRQDVDIAAMIKKLGNSDWVREGREFYEATGGTCPFCQQSTTEAFARSLNEYFDETFVADGAAIEDLANNYAADAARLEEQLDLIIADPSRHLDKEHLKTRRKLLGTRIALNVQLLARKKKDASHVIELESTADVVSSIRDLVDDANRRIETHNKMVANLATERTTLTGQVWRFVLEELRTDLAAFKSAKRDLDKAIVAMTRQIDTARREKTTKVAEIRELEKQTTSIQPTIDGINQLLASFGFRGFKVDKAASGTSYILVRADGTDAKTTLSEGEKTFVTFLYFFHLLKGSESDSGMTTDRVIVFDDPVSSLDSDILFIVASLIKGLFDEVRAGTGHIKQIFILTHNVYFHKEVTYSSKRRDVAMKEETFWVVRKPDLVSKIERHLTNPIKTSYDLLWDELRKKDRSNPGIQNTLRRILENYFKILGGMDFDALCAMFDGHERIICKSLCSWVHDGSHYAHDDLYVSIDESTVDKYLMVFRRIFYRTGHGAHYRMMMGDAFVEESAVAETP